jgi:hypothetical protein
MERIEVWRGAYSDPAPPFGPLPGVRDGQVATYEFGLPDQFIPRPRRTRLDRVFVLLDLGIQMVQPCGEWREESDSSRRPGLDAGLGVDTTWYVDLIEVTDQGSTIVVNDLYADVMVPMDGRHQRVLDLDELADAIEDGTVPIGVAIDGLRRWQRFLDRYLHADRDASGSWSEFPPRSILPLMELPSPLGTVVTVP